MTQTVTRPPADLLHDVQGVIAAAIERLRAVGWRRTNIRRAGAGDRLVDALNYGSAQAGADVETHRTALAALAMAIEPHTGTAAHALLPDALADAYLSPATSDDDLHRLDASIVVRFNAHMCTGCADAEALLRRAWIAAVHVIIAQREHARVGA
jgi:hypothetical protein